MPHIYGVSYPFVQGTDRRRPHQAGSRRAWREGHFLRIEPRSRKPPRPLPARLSHRYCEGSGTSQAAPHVSGVIAAFLSIRREFIQHPEDVKRIFMSSATDLNRERYFQGRGLVDLMRAIQSV